ncbi:hypothetical protein D1007_42308 [Hordeum vulgare]|nr:hypothetical protein D1007_42308 [Hordeum vulgare]
MPSISLKSAYPFFLHSIYAELVVSFSGFFYAIISLYQIRALQLQPNSVLLQVVFPLYCEAFVDVRPSVAHFRHFFNLWFTTNSHRSACVSFVDVGGVGTRLKDGKKVDGYRNH